MIVAMENGHRIEIPDDELCDEKWRAEFDAFDRWRASNVEVRVGQLREQQRAAIFSSCGRYRYALSSIWDLDNPRVMFLMLNPSTATELADDPTVRKCISYAHRWGFGGVWIGNVYAWRDTDPDGVKRAIAAGVDPIGPCNDAVLKWMAADAAMVVCAWSNHVPYDRANDVIDRLVDPEGRGFKADPPAIVRELHALKINTATSKPAHPLYLKNDLDPFVWVTPIGAGLRVFERG